MSYRNEYSHLIFGARPLFTGGIYDQSKFYAAATAAVAATVIGAVGVAASLASAGYAMSGAGNPSYPNMAASSGKMSNLQANMLPIERGFAAAGQSGGKFSFKIPEGTKLSDFGISSKPAGFYDANGKLISKNADHYKNPIIEFFQGIFGQGEPADVVPAGVTWKSEQPLSINGIPLNQKPDGSIEIDFAGYGQADVQGAIAKAKAANDLALQKKYDSQFIETALAQEKEADPESFAAKQRMWTLIQEGINNPTKNATSEMLANQVGKRVSAGKGLDEYEKAILDNAAKMSLASRGGSTVDANFEQPLTTGMAGNQRQLQGIGLATGALSSGTTPEDIAYRKEQQNLANLSAMINGKTPVTQFKGLSNAQNAPTPSAMTQPLPQMDNSTGLAASASAAQFANQASQADGWMAGLGTVLNATGALGQIVKQNQPQ